MACLLIAQAVAYAIGIVLQAVLGLHFAGGLLVLGLQGTSKTDGNNAGAKDSIALCHQTTGCARAVQLAPIGGKHMSSILHVNQRPSCSQHS